MKSMNLEFRGITPLLMHSNVGVNPLHPLVIEKKKYTGKRKKTEEDIAKIIDLDWELALYWEDGIGVYVPAQNVEATLREAAKKIRRGKDVISSIFVTPDFIPLNYPGPKEKEKLRQDIRYKDIRAGKLNNSQVMVCRPRFDRWSFDCTIEYDEDIFDEETILQILQIASKYIGICDYRPRYGKFEVIKK